MKYVYPAILFPDDGKIGVRVPDLPGCFTFGDDKADAIFMAKDAVEMWLCHQEDQHETIPRASNTLTVKGDDMLVWVAADTDEYRKANDKKAIKKTLSIPSWLNTKAERANAPFSQILQQGLKEYLNITD